MQAVFPNTTIERIIFQLPDTVAVSFAGLFLIES